MTTIKWLTTFGLLMVLNGVYHISAGSAGNLIYIPLYVWLVMLLVMPGKGLDEVFMFLLIGLSVFFSIDYTKEQIDVMGESGTFTHIQFGSFGVTIGSLVSLLSVALFVTGKRFPEIITRKPFVYVFWLLVLVMLFHVLQKVFYYKYQGVSATTLKAVCGSFFFFFSAQYADEGSKLRRLLLYSSLFLIIASLWGMFTLFARERLMFLGILSVLGVMSYVLKSRRFWYLLFPCLLFLAYCIVFQTFWLKVYILGYVISFVVLLYFRPMARMYLVVGVVFNLFVLLVVSYLPTNEAAASAYLRESRLEGRGGFGDLTSIDDSQELWDRIIFKVTADRASVWGGQLDSLIHDQAAIGVFPMPMQPYYTRGISAGEYSLWTANPHHAYLQSWSLYGFLFGTLYLVAVIYPIYWVLLRPVYTDSALELSLKSIALTVILVGFPAGDYFVSDLLSLFLACISGLLVGGACLFDRNQQMMVAR